MRKTELPVLALLLICLLSPNAAAQHEIPRSVMGNGGGERSGGSYTLGGTLGQAAVGHMAGSYTHEIGFWYPSAVPGSGVDDYSGIPTDFSLGASFPNPIRSTARLDFAVPERAHVEIKLYDITGRRLQTLVDSQIDPGVHTVQLSAAGLSGGIYFLRMTAGQFVQTRRLSLLK
ncbi:T9SS type A sorting domain-containing protein [Candidatus Eisenbacteria bacterium]|uniref:T9SS type A sorting domain-containing protein n=1 Tax=Eiseniibacteriota bacterium TaxID=2212470 RepID=A0ABV6YKN7_UNCEI